MNRYLFIICELASNGFGSPEVLYNERVDLVLASYDYLRFKTKYEEQSYLINKEAAE